MLSHGGSCIVGPLGTFLAEPLWDEEGIVYADLRMDELTEAKMEYVSPPLQYLTCSLRPIVRFETISLRVSTAVASLDDPASKQRNTDGENCEYSFDPVGSYSRPDVL